MQPAGDKKQLLEHQPPVSLGQCLEAGGKVDVLIGIVDITQLMGHAHCIRQHVRQQLPARVQPLPHRLLQQQLADAPGQRIHRHDTARQLVLPVRLHQGIHHLAAQEVALHLAAEHEAVAGAKALAVRLIEKGHVQRAGFVHRPHLHHRASAGDAAAGGDGGDHGPAAGRLPHRKLCNGIDDAAVLIAAGKKADQIPQSTDAQLFQRLGSCLADTLDVAHIGVQVCHSPASLFLFFPIIPVFRREYNRKETCPDGCTGSGNRL